MGDIEAAGINLLKRAVELDGKRRFTEAVICYEEGIALLIDVLKVTTEDGKKERFRQKVGEYMNRVEKLKLHMAQEKKTGKYHEQIQVDSDSTGNSYETLFARFFEPTVTHIEVEDPYIRNNHQIYNFLRFCELAVKKCNGTLQTMKLLTTKDTGPDNQQQQLNKLIKIRKSLETHRVRLDIEVSDTLHDREIRLNNGWIIKIGRGLDYFKPTLNNFCLGYSDFDLRPCHETTIDIFHKTTVKPAS